MNYLEEDEMIGIRGIAENDRDTYYKMAKARSLMKGIYDEIFESVWKEIITGGLVMFVAVEKETNMVCGFCQLDRQNPFAPEIGIDIIDEFMDKGYGTRTVAAVVRYASTWENIDFFVWKADKKNVKSRKIAEHLGGTLIQERKLLPKSMFRYGLEKGIIKEEDLTVVCKYQIQKN